MRLIGRPRSLFVETGKRSDGGKISAGAQTEKSSFRERERGEEVWSSVTDADFSQSRRSQRGFVCG